MSYDAVRKDYVKYTLNDEECLEDPITMLDQWLKQALEESQDANALTLSTVSADGVPSSRIVLLRKLDERGIVIFTNYTSHKAEEMEQNPVVAVNFFWPWIERQVRITGKVERLSGKESDDYFQSRPRMSRIGAWASDQSDELENREMLERRMDELVASFEGKEVPRPDFWGGYLIRPTRFEFWQGRASRLHDRIVYTPDGNTWSRKRLYP